MSSLIKKSSLFPQWGFMDAVFREPFSDWMNSAPFQTVPAVNISESKDQFVIEMAAPGLKKEDFSIEVDGTHMTIQCEKEVKKEDKEKNYRKQEFSYSCFSRSFSLPSHADGDKMTANYQNGVLQINLPKKKNQAAKNVKTVPVK